PAGSCSNLQLKTSEPAIEGIFRPTLFATDGCANRNYLQLNLQSTAPTCNHPRRATIICN
ncbi:MAG TPA: hypothetical protein VJ508_10885, partial [Saprospiraceae bacterium]|nr:hypothetical protein [Saprospiraceae bacterium]